MRRVDVASMPPHSSEPGKRWRAARAACVLIVATASACGDGIVIADVRLPDPAGAVTSASAVARRGVLDVCLATSYVASIRVLNDGPGTRVDSARIALSHDHPEGAAVDLGDGRSSWTVPGTAYLATGETFVEVELVPVALALALQDTLRNAGPDSPRITLVARVELLDSQQRAVTDAFFFPIDAVFGTLVDFPFEADDPAADGAICDATTPPPPPPFRIGQDQRVDCRSCRNTHACCAR